MNKKNFLKMSILFAALGILAFSFIPHVNAGIPPFIPQGQMSNNLLLPTFVGESWPFSASENLFFAFGWASTEEEIENDLAPKNPWEIKLFINNEEIVLRRYDIFVKDITDPEMIKNSVWYYIFGPEYFAPGGEYLLRWEFWVKRPYQGDGKNYWRIFVDYGGYIFGVPGLEFRFEYYLNIVE
ncbi:MAG: hypothetical protein ACFFAK_07535 [Promethearchaeota archaeon]